MPKAATTLAKLTGELAPLSEGRQIVKDLISDAKKNSADDANKIAAVTKLTPFQIDVLSACACVPSGFVTTYGKIAAVIKKPQGARGVGQALSKNPFAPTIPCHRVVGSDGFLTGYSGVAGVVSKKAKLLKDEGVSISSTGYVVKAQMIQ